MSASNRLAGRVVVITGASSGLGRAAAVEFARCGCSVVLAARRADALDETARQCELDGGRALVVVTDVTVEEDLVRLRDFALARFGRIDVWVNNAGVTLFAQLDEAPFEEHRRVIETNVLGAMLAARAIMPVFRYQQFGTLINVGSILSKIGQPFVPSYVISKFALRGLSEALRTEVANYPHIHVCTLLPYTIDTQHFESAASVVGHEAHAMPPVQSPVEVARALVDLARRPRRELHVPKIARLGLLLHELSPNITERLLLRSLEAWHFAERRQPGTLGNLFSPGAHLAKTHGRRRPRIASPAFALWVTGQLVRMPFESARRAMGRSESPARPRPRHNGGVSDEDMLRH